MRTFDIASDADVRTVEGHPYTEFMAHKSVFDALSAAASEHAARPALTYLESADGLRASCWTYRSLLDEVVRAAQLFRELGGDEPRVAMLLPAVPQAYFTLLGAEAVGVVCPINYLLAESHICELVQAAHANVLVTLAPDPSLDIWSKVAALKRECRELRHVVAVGTAPDTIDFEQARRRQPGQAIELRGSVQADAVAALFHTGGTTGAPKLAQHTHGNQLHSSWGAAQMYAMTPRDKIINGFPLFHVAGSFVFGLSTLLSGGELILPTLLGMRNPEFVRRYWDVVERFGATLIAAVPTVMSALMNVDRGEADIRSVRAVLTGGSPLPPELATSFEGRFGIPVRNILGMTECAGVISIEPFRAARVPGSCGLRLPYTEVVAVVERPGEPLRRCGPGETGILRVRGPNVGPGYTDPRRNAGTFDAGWLSTGDIGSVDGEGRVFVTGRAKDLIIRSGHNIEPGLIEDALMRHPDVQFAAAVGAPDAYAGEVPVAYVVLGPGAEVDVGALSQFLAQHVHEPPAMPKWIEALPALPLTAVGKVYKPQLRVRAMERAIGERLCGSSLAGSVTIRGLDLASGPCLEFEPVSGGDRSLLDVDVRAFMAPYAIAWRWAQASGAGPDHAPPSPASGDPASLT